MSETAIIALISGILTVVSTTITGWMAYIMLKVKLDSDDAKDERAAMLAQADRAEKAALQAGKLAEATSSVVTAKMEVQAIKADKTMQTLTTVHSLVNSAMSIALEVAAKATRKFANLSGKPEDAREAHEAEERLKRHLEANVVATEKAAGALEKANVEKETATIVKENIAAAQTGTKKALLEHEAKQAVVDSGKQG